MIFQDFDTEHYGYEDLTQTGQEGDALAVDTSSFKDAGVSELFLQEDQEQGSRARTYEEVDSPIRKLKEIILGLDWEITDESIERFLETANELQREWQSDRIISTFLKVLKSITQYIGANKSNAHADSINLLFSLYNALEKIVLSPDMSESIKEKLLNEELAKSQTLKRIIARSCVAHLEKIIQKSRRDGTPDSPRTVLLPLKVLVLSFDGKKTGKIMQKFCNEIKFLQNKWQNDKNLLHFLKMLRATGEYINSQGAQAVPDAAKLFLATYNSLERIVLTDGLSEKEKRKITEKTFEKFNQLKSRIAREKDNSPQPAAIKTVQQGTAVPDMSADSGQHPETVVSPAAAEHGDTRAEEWTPQTLETHLDRLFQERCEEGITLPFFEGRERETEIGAHGNSPALPDGPPAAISGKTLEGPEQGDQNVKGPTSAEIIQGIFPARPEAGVAKRDARVCSSTGTCSEKLAEVVNAVDTCSREVEQLRTLIVTLSEKIDLLLNQQMPE